MKGRIAVALSLALTVVWAFFARTYSVAAGTMLPTHPIGERVVVVSYGVRLPGGTWAFRWANPQVGEVVVFEAPPWVASNTGEDWIKRIIAVGGQRVAFKDAAFVVDGQPCPLTAPDGAIVFDEDGVVRGVPTEYQDYDQGLNRWTTEYAALKAETLVRTDGVAVKHSIFNDLPPRTRTWPVRGLAPRLTGLRCTDTACVVQEGYVFVAGDNRDRSSDSRMWGGVPVNNVKGSVVW